MAKELGLNRSENFDANLRTSYTKDELALMKELVVPASSEAVHEGDVP